MSFEFLMCFVLYFVEFIIVFHWYFVPFHRVFFEILHRFSFPFLTSYLVSLKTSNLLYFFIFIFCDIYVLQARVAKEH